MICSSHKVVQMPSNKLANWILRPFKCRRGGRHFARIKNLEVAIFGLRCMPKKACLKKEPASAGIKSDISLTTGGAEVCDWKYLRWDWYRKG